MNEKTTKKHTPLNNTWKSQQNFSDTFHKMCAFYSVNAFGRLLWTSHSVKFFLVFVVFSFSFVRCTHSEKNASSGSWMNAANVIWLTLEPFPQLNSFNASAKRNASNYCQMYIDDAVHTRKCARIRFCASGFYFERFSLFMASTSTNWMDQLRLAHSTNIFRLIFQRFFLFLSLCHYYSIPTLLTFDLSFFLRAQTFISCTKRWRINLRHWLHRNQWEWKMTHFAPN